MIEPNSEPRSGTATLHVTFRVGNATYVLAAADVLHLESYDTATHVPGAPAYVAGLVQVRGRLVPVVDLRVRFGLPAIQAAPAMTNATATGAAAAPQVAMSDAMSEAMLNRRVVVVQLGTRVAGLLVDSAREVLKIEDAAFEKPPEIIAQQTAGFVKAVATIAKRMYLLVDVPRIIGQELTHG
jgi:purine-binding chemotaxis protein CheW